MYRSINKNLIGPLWKDSYATGNRHQYCTGTATGRYDASTPVVLRSNLFLHKYFFAGGRWLVWKNKNAYKIDAFTLVKAVLYHIKADNRTLA